MHVEIPQHQAFVEEQRLECDGHDIDDVKRILVLSVCALENLRGPNCRCRPSVTETEAVTLTPLDRITKEFFFPFKMIIACSRAAECPHSLRSKASLNPLKL